MTRSADLTSARPVMVVGPSPTEIGGMASVVSQMLSLDFADRYRLRLLPLTRCTDPGERLGRRVLRHVRTLQNLRQTIRASGSRLVHLHTCSGFSFYRTAIDMHAARRRGARVVLHIHGAKFDRFYENESMLQQWLIRRCLSRADSVIALSSEWSRRLREMAPGATLRVIENAVEIPTLCDREPHVGVCRFLLLARMDRWKGIDDLLTAAARLHHGGTAYELVLAGPAGTAGDAFELRRKIVEFKLEGVVRYVGPVRGEEKSKLLEWADVYVQPSHHEGMPISMLEALAHRQAIVATAVGAVPDVIKHGQQGYVVPPHQPDAFAACMRELAEHPDRRNAMAHAGRTLVEARFGLPRFRDDLIRLYDELVATPRRSESAAARSDVAATPSRACRRAANVAQQAARIRAG